MPIIDAREPAPCDLCGAVKELRPYGPEESPWICFECMKKDEEACAERFVKMAKGGILHVTPAERAE